MRVGQIMGLGVTGIAGLVAGAFSVEDPVLRRGSMEGADYVMAAQGVFPDSSLPVVITDGVRDKAIRQCQAEVLPLAWHQGKNAVKLFSHNRDEVKTHACLRRVLNEAAIDGMREPFHGTRGNGFCVLRKGSDGLKTHCVVPVGLGARDFNAAMLPSRPANFHGDLVSEYKWDKEDTPLTVMLELYNSR